MQSIYTWLLSVAAQRAQQLADWLECRYMKTAREPKLNMVTWPWEPATDDRDDTTSG